MIIYNNMMILKTTTSTVWHINHVQTINEIENTSQMLFGTIYTGSLVLDMMPVTWKESTWQNCRKTHIILKDCGI